MDKNEWVEYIQQSALESAKKLLGSFEKPASIQIHKLRQKREKTDSVV